MINLEILKNTKVWQKPSFSQIFTDNLTTQESPSLTFYCLGVFHNAKYFLNDAVAYIVLEAYSHLSKYYSF